MMKKIDESPLISIIIPVYNVAPFLSQCIQSVLDQTYTHLEVIIVDDGSTDESPAICDKFAKLDTRIKVIHKKNGGQSDARNAGLDIASGDLIGFVDSDDWIENDMYETLYNLLSKYQADISACAHYIEYGTKIKAAFESKEIITFNHKDAMMALIKDKIIRNYVWEKLYKRELFNNLRFPMGNFSKMQPSVTRYFIELTKRY